MKRSGSKTNHWGYIRRQLKCQFEAMGITRCERCGGTFALGFAHRLKRRFITDDDELRTVALLCQVCHDLYEYAGHEVMYAGIDQIIQKRNEQIQSAA